MADIGFEVPPGAQTKSHMTSAEVKKTKNLANFRICVECAINSTKTIRILDNTLPISLLHHIDDRLWTYAALCNLKRKCICLMKEADKSNV